MQFVTFFGYSILLLIVQIIPSTMQTLLLGPPEPNFHWWYLGHYLGLGVMSVLFFTFVGKRKPSHPYIYSFGLLLLVTVMVESILILVYGEFVLTVESFYEGVISTLALVVGTIWSKKISQDEGISHITSR